MAGGKLLYPRFKIASFHKGFSDQNGARSAASEPFHIRAGLDATLGNQKGRGARGGWTGA